MINNTSSILSKHLEKFESSMVEIGKQFQCVIPNSICKLDITIAQFHVLKNIMNLKTAKMSDLSRAMGVTLGNMTAMIDRLIRENLVIRHQDAEDRRIVNISLSSKGKNFMKKAVKHRNQMLGNLLKLIPEKDIIILIRILEDLVENKHKKEGK
jgi:DNA-binding MarR family transcriptional regulator